MNTYSIYFYLLLILETIVLVVTVKRYVKFVILPRRNPYPQPAKSFANYLQVREKDPTLLQ